MEKHFGWIVVRHDTFDDRVKHLVQLRIWRSLRELICMRPIGWLQTPQESAQPFRGVRRRNAADAKPLPHEVRREVVSDARAHLRSQLLTGNQGAVLKTDGSV